MLRPFPLHLIALFALVSALLASPAEATPDTPAPKARSASSERLARMKDMVHVGGSLLLGTLGEAYASSDADWNKHSIAAGVAIAMVPGVLKEVVDSAQGYKAQASIHDLKLDLAGAVVGAGLSYLAREHLGFGLSLSSGWALNLIRRDKTPELQVLISLP